MSYAFKQCKNFENRLRFDKVTKCKAGIFFETQCSYTGNTHCQKLLFDFHENCRPTTENNTQEYKLNKILAVIGKFCIGLQLHYDLS